MKVYVLEIPHQLPPKLRLLSEVRLKDEPVLWQEYKSKEDLKREFGDEIPAIASEIIEKHGSAIECGIRDSIKWYAPGDCGDDEFSLQCESAFGDNQWYWIGALEEIMSNLPRHQKREAQALIESEMNQK